MVSLTGDLVSHTSGCLQTPIIVADSMEILIIRNLRDWHESANRVSEQFQDLLSLEFRDDPATKIDLRQSKNDSDFPGIIVKDDYQTRLIIVHHPLWDVNDLSGIFAKYFAKISAEFGEDCNYQFIDTFNLIRRPAWCYSTLFSTRLNQHVIR